MATGKSPYQAFAAERSGIDPNIELPDVSIPLWLQPKEIKKPISLLSKNEKDTRKLNNTYKIAYDLLNLNIPSDLTYDKTRWVFNNLFGDDFQLSNKFFIEIISSTNYGTSELPGFLGKWKGAFQNPFKAIASPMSNIPDINDSGSIGGLLGTAYNKERNLSVLYSFLVDSVTIPGLKTEQTTFKRFGQDFPFANNASYENGLVISWRSDTRNKIDLFIRQIIENSKYSVINSNGTIPQQYDIRVTQYSFKKSRPQINTPLGSLSGPNVDILKNINSQRITFHNVIVDNVNAYTMGSDASILEKSVQFNFSGTKEEIFSEQMFGLDLDKYVTYYYMGKSLIESGSLFGVEF